MENQRCPGGGKLHRCNYGSFRISSRLMDWVLQVTLKSAHNVSRLAYTYKLQPHRYTLHESAWLLVSDGNDCIVRFAFLFFALVPAGDLHAGTSLLYDLECIVDWLCISLLLQAYAQFIYTPCVFFPVALNHHIMELLVLRKKMENDSIAEHLFQISELPHCLLNSLQYAIFVCNFALSSVFLVKVSLNEMIEKNR